MDDRWRIERDGDELPQLRCGDEYVCSLSPEQAESLEPLLNPLPTMTGREIVRATETGQRVEVFKPEMGGWVEPHRHGAGWQSYGHLDGHSFVARVVDPEPEPEPQHNKNVDPWNCAACNPDGLSPSDWRDNWRRSHTDDPAPVSDDPLPEGIVRLPSGRFVADYNTPSVEGWEYRFDVERDRWDTCDDSGSITTDEIIEVRPVSVPDTEQVPLHKLIGRTIPGCDWRIGTFYSNGSVVTAEADDATNRKASAPFDASTGLVTVLREEQADRT